MTTARRTTLQAVLVVTAGLIGLALPKRAEARVLSCEQHVCADTSGDCRDGPPLGFTCESPCNGPICIWTQFMDCETGGWFCGSAS
jgi:hypothetical protein